MSANANEKFEPRWGNCKVSYYKGDRSVMSSFHSHKYYEVSLIISGCVRSLLCDRYEDSDKSRLVLTSPGTPHYIYMTSPSLYERVNLCFSVEFITDCIPEWRSLSKIFGRNGNIIPLNGDSCEMLKEKIHEVELETNDFRKKLKILEILSLISELDSESDGSSPAQPPRYVVDALTYIQEHYAEHIIAADLAWTLGISRTTLMTAFKRHTDTTLSEYITRVRVKKATSFIRLGATQEQAAEQAGFGNGGSLIRAFRHCYGMTPKQYMKSLTDDGKSDK